MGAWWDDWTGRLAAELESFARRGLPVQQDNEGFAEGRVVLHARLDVDGEEVAIDVRYPATFPWTRFSIDAPGLDLGRHQNPFQKNLCVFPRASVHWRPEYLAGDVVAERVADLIRAVRAGGDELRDAEEPQGEPYSDYFDYAANGAFLVPDQILDGAVGVDGGQFTVRMSDANEWVGPDVQIADVPPVGNGTVIALRRGKQLIAEAEPAVIAALDGPTVAGAWVRLDSPPAGPGVQEFMDHVAAVAPLLAEPRGSKWNFVGVVFPEEVRHGEYADTWIFAATRRIGKEPRKQDRVKKVQRRGLLIRGLRCGITQLSDRIPELAPLRGKTAGVLGLGSLGAPLSIELAKGLLGGLKVADYDFVDPGTAVRWEGGMAAAGPRKVLEIADRIRRHYPYTSVTPHPLFVGDGDGDGAALDDFIAGTDLIIDATAEDNVSAAVAYRAWVGGIGFITFWSVEGAGGVVARIVPGETGCFHCLRLHLSSDAGGTIPSPKPYGAALVQPRGCADPTFTATAPDLRPLVDQAARVTFGELCRKAASGYPRYGSDVQVLFLRNADGTLTDPPRWESHPLTVHPRCPLHADDAS